MKMLFPSTLMNRPWSTHFWREGSLVLGCSFAEQENNTDMSNTAIIGMDFNSILSPTSWLKGDFSFHINVTFPRYLYHDGLLAAIGIASIDREEVPGLLAVPAVEKRDGLLE